jgi:predicted O-linked N-acetylglucosamine transferase (SPINDLY family)
MKAEPHLILRQAFQDFQMGQLIKAEDALKHFLSITPDNFDANHLLAVIYASQNKHFDAVECYKKALTIRPNDAQVLSNWGSSLSALGRNQEAFLQLQRALEVDLNNHDCWYNAGNVLCDLERYEEALIYYGQAIKLNPQYYQAHNNYGKALFDMGSYADSLAYFDKAIAINCDFSECLINKGASLKKLKHYDEALACDNQVISMRPDYAEAYSNKGITLHELKRYEEAITQYDTSLSLKPNYAEAYSNKGNALHELKRYEEAITQYDTSLSLKPDYAEAYFNKGNTLHELKCYEEAITQYDAALSLKPDYAEAWASKANTLNTLRLHTQAAECYFKAADFSVEDTFFYGHAHHQMMLGCDWANYEKITNEIFARVNEGKKISHPFGFQGISSSEVLVKRCTEVYVMDKFPVLGSLYKDSKNKHNKIRIGYLSGEFREQATSILMSRVWELHDKSKFEIYAFDSGWKDNSEYRIRIEKSFSNIFDVSRLSDLEIAKLIVANDIDILVNLNGFFGQGRQGVFSYKPSPIQVNYLGYPGTLGASYMDYIIADRVVLPEESQENYVEKVVYLPNSYQANDNKRVISKRQFTKAELGLPENSFVYACFNNNYKITPSTFDSWMRILIFVEGSVLWLLADNPIAKENLIKAASSRGVDPSRLIFADRLSNSEHLARHRLANLFLDTLPCNAHTTCSDALWAGVPVLTLIGSTFSGRVAASLLKAVGLDELITNTQEDYEMLAIELGMNQSKLEMLKERMSHNLSSAALFDSDLITTNLEAAYIKMYERYQADLLPVHMSIA